MALIIKRKTEPAPVQLIATEPSKTKTVIKVGGNKPMPTAAAPKSDAALTPRQQQKLEDSGLVDESAPPPLAHVGVGDLVTITNSKFPWVQHWKPGDQATVREVRDNKDPLGVDNTGRYQGFRVEITHPKEPSRKGQTAFLFRHEFELSTIFDKQRKEKEWS